MDNKILRLLQLLDDDEDDVGAGAQVVPARFPRFMRRRNNPFEDITVSDAVFKTR